MEKFRPGRKPEARPPDMSRRRFLGGMFATVGAAVAGSAIVNADIIYLKHNLILKSLRDLSGNGEESSALVEKAIQFFRDYYGVEVSFGDTWDFHGSAEDLTNEQKVTSLEYLLNEIEKYPPDFFKRNNLPKIRIVNDIQLGSTSGSLFEFFKTKSVDGLAYQDIYTVILEHRDLSTDFAQTFHHELYHILDFRDDNFAKNQEAWTSLHRTCACNSYGNDDTDKESTKWHARAYGATNPLEDRATFAEGLFVPGEHAALYQRIISEPDPTVKTVLLNKYQKVKAHYFKWSGGTMDDLYWEKIMTAPNEGG